VRDILELSRNEAGIVENERILIDLAAFCRSVIEQVSNDGHQAIQYTGPEADAMCLVDERLLFQVLENLLTNALKYSSPQSPVELRLVPDGEWFLFQVIDQGIGIPEGDQKMLFTRFYRGRNVSHITGTGLGLMLVKKSVELLGGSVKLESQLGIGTTASVVIPCGLKRKG
jgi:signal transduction histidine kinase